ncbi:hypothetical protein BG005_002717 [Podila minutissima]|nr:hypothetical protein BG005_002717 [Podila minutissima]
MTDNRLSLSCLVDREATSNAFSIKILSSDTVDTLKGLIKTAVSHRFNDIAIKDLTLWQVSIPNDDQGSVITIDALDDKTELTNAGTQLSKLFPERPDDDTYIVVKRPPARKHLGTYTLLDAIEETGLSEKAVVDGQSDLSLLNNKERVLLLDFLGQSVDRSERYNSLSSTARQLQGTNIKDMDKLSAPRSARFPGIGTNDLYVRQAYKDLFDKILGKFENNHEFKKHVIVTGTSGIGNSAFLVYFAIRLLAESDESNPPMIIFHTNYREECYIFGGHTTVRYGNIDDFRPFLNLPDTWYLVDGSLKPLLSRAKTVISAPPKTLQGHQYKDVDRSVVWRYFMAPWNLEERKNCRSSVTAFQVVPEETMEELYSEIGGVPRYVLDWPTEISSPTI